MIPTHPTGRLAEHEERRIKEIAQRRQKEHQIIKRAIERTEKLLAKKNSEVKE